VQFGRDPILVATRQVARGASQGQTGRAPTAPGDLLSHRAGSAESGRVSNESFACFWAK